MWVGGWWCLNVDLVIGFGPSLGLALWPRAKPIKSWRLHENDFAHHHHQQQLIVINISIVAKLSSSWQSSAS